MRLSLRNRLALVFFAITLLAIGVLYLYVAPGLQTRLMGEKLSELPTAARTHSGRSAARWAARRRCPTVRALVVQRRRRPRRPGDAAVGQPRPGRLAALRARPTRATRPGPALAFPVAYRAMARRRVAPAPSRAASGDGRRGRLPVIYQGRVGCGDRLLGAGLRHHAQRRHRPPRDPRGRRRSRCCWRWSAAIWWRGRWPSGSSASSWRPSRSPPASSATRSRSTPPTSSGSWRWPSTTCSTSSRQLDLARKKFIATASHELRTPIFSLGGFVELLEDEELDPETRRRFLDQVRDQVQRLGKLSVDLLDLSRLEAGSLELRPEEVDLGRADPLGVRGIRAHARPARCAAGAAAAGPADRGPVRSGPGRPDHADPDRQRADPHAAGDPDRGHRRRATTAACGWRCATTARASTRRRCRGSSSRSIPPTTPRAPAWAWRSPASWPSGWRAAVGAVRRRARRRSRSRSRPDAASGLQASSGLSHTSLRVGNAGSRGPGARSGTSPTIAMVAACSDSATRAR